MKSPIRNTVTRGWMKRSAASFALLALGAVNLIHAQTATVYSTGFISPSKIILGPAGTLLVSESGTKANTGRVSIVSASGTRRTLIDGLPSGLSAPNLDPDGPNGMALVGNTLYLAIGEGDSLANGTVPNTAIGNPAGPASPVLDSVLQIDFSQSVDKLATNFTLGAADHFTLADGNPVALSNANKDTATINLLSLFRVRPDPVAIYRNSHPYGMTTLDSDPTHLYLTDAGLNSVVQIDLKTGRPHTLTNFPNQANYAPLGGPVAEAVPDSVRPFGNQLLVTLLTGFPFGPVNSRVMIVDPATGKANEFINGLTSTIDIASRDRGAGVRPQFFVLEYSAALLGGAPGRVLVFNTPAATLLLDGLHGPSSMALDATAGTLYITSKTDGTVLKFDVGK